MSVTKSHSTKLFENYAIDSANKIINDMINKNYIQSLEASEVNSLLSRDDIQSSGILIRYPNTQNVFTIRLDEPIVKADGKAIKYLKPTGQKNHIYTPPSVEIKSLDEIWITEGELKALSASIRNLPVIALSGIWNWRKGEDECKSASSLLNFGTNKNPDDSSKIIKCLKTLPWSNKTVILIYDSDITQKHDAWVAFPRLAEQLYRLGAKSVKIINCPKIEFDNFHQTKIGLDDLFVFSQKSDGAKSEENIINALKKHITETPIWIPSADGSDKFISNILNTRRASDDLLLLGAISAYMKGHKLALSDFVNKLPKGYDYLNKSVPSEAYEIRSRQSKKLPDKLPLDRLKNGINDIQRKAKKNEIHGEIEKKDVFNLVFNSLEAVGDFFSSKDNNIDCWYFHRESKIMYNIHSVDFESFLTKITQTPTVNSYGKGILNNIYSRVAQNSKKVVVHLTSFFDTQNKLLYLDVYDGEMLKLNGDEITNVPIGTDDVYFTHPSDWKPWNYKAPTDKEVDSLVSLLLNYNYLTSSKITPCNAQIIILTWILASFFRELHPTRALLLITGEKGCGKSSFARSILQTLYGEHADVSVPLKSNLDQIVSLLTNRSMLSLDNMDSRVDCMLDILATSATGGKIPKRVLYKTNALVEYVITAWIIITARTPKLQRDDIAERLITINLKKLTSNTPESVLLKRTSKSRDSNLSTIAYILNELLGFMKNGCYNPKNETFRLADFASFLRLILVFVAGEDKGNVLADKIIAEINLEQSAFYIDEDPLILAIRDMLDTKKLQYDNFYKISDLVNKLNEAYALQSSNFRISSTRALTSMFRERVNASASIHNLDIIFGKTQGYITVKFVEVTTST